MRTSPLEKSLPVKRNDNLKDYGESGIDNNLGRKKNGKRRLRKRKKLFILNLIQIMMWKCNQRMLMTEKQYTTMNLVVKTRAESKPTQKTFRELKMTMKNQGKMIKMIRPLSPRK